MKYSSKSLTDVGKVRSANEDNLGEAQTPNGHLFVVCDGMGGHVGGAQASLIAVNSIIEYFQREVYDNVIQAIDHALSFANEQIYASALSNLELKGMGTTAVILLIRGEECFVGHVGDSRIYLLSDGKLNRITKDHSFVQTLVDSGIIEDEDAENHPNKNQILQALGIASSVKGTISQTPILPKAGDMFLLCSDGLNGMVKDKNIEKIMQENNLQVTAESLITAALNGGGQDNITASLVLIEDSPHQHSRFTHFNPSPKKKIVDFTSTQQFGENQEKTKKKKSFLPYLIGGGVLSVILIITLIKLFVIQNANIETKKGSVHDENYLKAYPCENINEIQLNTQVNFSSDRIDKVCGNIKRTFIIREYRIADIQIDTLKSHQIIETKNPKEEKAKSNKDKKEKEKTEEKKVEKSGNIIYTVKKGENLEGIKNKYLENCPDLSVDLIIDANENNPKLTLAQKDMLTKEKIDIGMHLIIPCEQKNQ
jgi:serine/threonine protein phosphatase PrpC